MSTATHTPTTRPLVGYASLASVYATGVGAAALAIARRSKRTGQPVKTPKASDLVLLGIASFKISRLLTRDSVTAFVRAPFVEPQGRAPAAGEVKEKPVGGTMRKAVGELLTCPFCLDQWVATAALLSFLGSPKLARSAAAGMTIVSIADVGQYGYRLIQKTDED